MVYCGDSLCTVLTSNYTKYSSGPHCEGILNHSGIHYARPDVIRFDHINTPLECIIWHLYKQLGCYGSCLELFPCAIVFGMLQQTKNALPGQLISIQGLYLCKKCTNIGIKDTKLIHFEAFFHLWCNTLYKSNKSFQLGHHTVYCTRCDELHTRASPSCCAASHRVQYPV